LGDCEAFKEDTGLACVAFEAGSGEAFAKALFTAAAAAGVEPVPLDDGDLFEEGKVRECVAFEAGSDAVFASVLFFWPAIDAAPVSLRLTSEKSVRGKAVVYRTRLVAKRADKIILCAILKFENTVRDGSGAKFDQRTDFWRTSLGRHFVVREFYMASIRRHTVIWKQGYWVDWMFSNKRKLSG
jgi:hypothetical protein